MVDSFLGCCKSRVMDLGVTSAMLLRLSKWWFETLFIFTPTWGK